MSHNSGRATGSRKEKCTHTKGARRQKRGWAERSSDATGRPSPRGTQDGGGTWYCHPHPSVPTSDPMCSYKKIHFLKPSNDPTNVVPSIHPMKNVGCVHRKQIKHCSLENNVNNS